MQLELPPFSHFTPSLLVFTTLLLAAAWGWSIWLLATRISEVRVLPAWAWVLLLILVPLPTTVVFLLVGAPPITSQAWRTAGLAVVVGLLVVVGVVAVQQIGIMDCRTVHRTEVCSMASRSYMVPVWIAALAMAVVVGLRSWRRRPRSVSIAQPT